MNHLRRSNTANGMGKSGREANHDNGPRTWRDLLIFGSVINLFAGQFNVRPIRTATGTHSFVAVPVARLACIVLGVGFFTAGERSQEKDNPKSTAECF